MTKTIAAKQWTRPELVRLGSIVDVAGAVAASFQNGKHARS